MAGKSSQTDIPEEQAIDKWGLLGQQALDILHGLTQRTLDAVEHFTKEAFERPWKTLLSTLCCVFLMGLVGLLLKFATKIGVRIFTGVWFAVWAIGGLVFAAWVASIIHGHIGPFLPWSDNELTKADIRNVWNAALTGLSFLVLLIVTWRIADYDDKVFG